MMLLVWLVAGTSHAFYHPETGRWLSRDPIGETGGANLHAALLNSPIAVIDPDGRTGRVTVPKCSIVVYFGHNRAKAPRVPPSIKNERCSAASVVACSGGDIAVQTPIPGIGVRPDGTIQFGDAVELAESDWKQASKHAETLCKCCRKSCKSITVKFSCHIDRLDYLLLRDRKMCSRKRIVDCGAIK